MLDEHGGDIAMQLHKVLACHFICRHSDERYYRFFLFFFCLFLFFCCFFLWGGGEGFRARVSSLFITQLFSQTVSSRSCDRE